MVTSEPSDLEELRARDRLMIVEALLDVIDDPLTFVQLFQRCRSRSEVVARLMSECQYLGPQAEHVADFRLELHCSARVEELRREATDLRRRLR